LSFEVAAPVSHPARATGQKTPFRGRPAVSPPCPSCWRGVPPPPPPPPHHPPTTPSPKTSMAPVVPCASAHHAPHWPSRRDSCARGRARARRDDGDPARAREGEANRTQLCPLLLCLLPSPSRLVLLSRSWWWGSGAQYSTATRTPLAGQRWRRRWQREAQTRAAWAYPSAPFARAFGNRQGVSKPFAAVFLLVRCGGC
jgi:hypothetical protein